MSSSSSSSDEQDDRKLCELLVSAKANFVEDKLSEITHLKLIDLQLSLLPQALWRLTNMVELDLGNNQLSTLPADIGNLQQLKLLNLMNNRLSSLPSSIGNLTLLEILGLKSNQLVELPEEIGSLGRLHSLFITDNRLVHLPSSIGRLTSLRKLQAAENRLVSLPDSISGLTRLELFRMPSNCLSSLSSSLHRLPSLCWVSLSANPICPLPAASSSHNLPLVPLPSLQKDESLGAGASGTVYASHWEGRRVALKIFKSQVSPDGPCAEEMRVACLLEHPHLPKIFALIENQQGVVMSLLDGKPLADRPNASSLLRSRYALDLRFSINAAYSILIGVASSLKYLHGLHVCHGDVYAHNILFRASATEPYAWLCDFGAAFFYAPSIHQLEQLEVRAYSILITEIIQRTEQPVHERWSALAIKCAATDPQMRPLFREICEELAKK